MPNPAVVMAITHFLKAAAEFADALRKTENTGEPVTVSNDAMTGFMMMLDFIHSKPKGIVINEKAQAAGIKPMVFDMDLIALLVEYIASETRLECECPVCSAQNKAEECKGTVEGAAPTSTLKH